MARTGAEVSRRHTTVSLEGAGHWIPEEAPDALVDAWRAWRRGLL